MGDHRGAPGFGQVDLDLGDEPNVTARLPASPSSSTLTGAPASHRNFGEVDLDLGDGDVAGGDEAPPPSTSRVFGPAKSAAKLRPQGPARSRKPTDQTVARSVSLDDLDSLAALGSLAQESEESPASVHNESTRIFSGEALAASTRPPPPLEHHEQGSDGHTRAWSEIDDGMFAGAEHDAPLSSRSSGQGAPSGSGVASRDGRVAAMRDLYAKGDADGALALAASLGNTIAPPDGADHPDASIVVEYGEQSIDLLDPFGGLIPIDDELAAAFTVPPPAPPASHLTLTERHSIPRLLKSMAEVSKLRIDHRAGFLLAHFDGNQTLEEILDICAMPTAEALALISSLKEMGVIEFE
jgi:hypothetical protein